MNSDLYVGHQWTKNEKKKHTKTAIVTTFFRGTVLNSGGDAEKEGGLTFYWYGNENSIDIVIIASIQIEYFF